MWAWVGWGHALELEGFVQFICCVSLVAKSASLTLSFLVCQMGIMAGGWQKEETELICLKGPETCVLVVSGAECSFPSLTSHTIPPSAPIVPTLTESAPAPSSSWHGPGPAALQAPSHTWRPSFQSPVASAPALPAAGPSLPDTWAQKEERKKGSAFD